MVFKNRSSSFKIEQLIFNEKTEKKMTKKINGMLLLYLMKYFQKKLAI